MTEQKQPKRSGPVNYHTGKFPPKKAIDWQQLVPLIGPASDAVARFDGLLTAMPNSYILMSPLMTQEAVLSSRIEGTQATMGEVMEFEAGLAKEPDAEKVAAFEEVLNYRYALDKAIALLSKLPICGRLLRQVHDVLLSGVRGHNRGKGKFRVIQNYIGAIGCTEEQARFVPISPENLTLGMKQWEVYLNSNAPDLLVQLAIVYAEFESLHPFL
ncbi:MAG: Fic/DOC family N-terminal domain-containing protein, partial [Planctomycetia bacterium]